MHISHLWYRLRRSFWFVPSLITIAAGILSQLTLFIDSIVNPSESVALGWIYSGGGAAASTLLSAIAGSMITATSVTFSMTLVALALTASQYGPRLLGNFMSRPGSQVVLGTFLATFIFSLLVLRAVRITGEDAGVPHLSVTVAIGLALASIGVLIFFIHHIATSIQADKLINQVYTDLVASIERMIPKQQPARTQAVNQEQAGHLGKKTSWTPLCDGMWVSTPSTGYFQAINMDGLTKLATAHDLVVRFLRRPGHFMIEGQPLAIIYPYKADSEELVRRIGDHMVLGQERISEQDLEFLILNLVEVALRALSPGINDPHTAIRCVDWLGAALCHIGQRDPPDLHRYDDAGKLRLVMHDASFEDLADAAFNQLRQASAGKPALFLRLLESMTAIVTLGKSVVVVSPLRRHADMVLTEADRTIPAPHDRSEIKGQHQRFLQMANRVQLE